jgi:hypothetical protein
MKFAKELDVLDQKHLMELLQRIKKVNKSEGYDR